jgi:glycosyltransferase involved in cell wall biosynthesis
MKILIVTNFLPPKIGGIERLTHELARTLAKEETIHVTVACSKWPDKHITSPVSQSNLLYSVVYFPSLIVAKRLPIPKLHSRNFYRALQSLDANYDLILFQSHLFVLNWLLAIRYRNTQRRIWMSHACNFIPSSSYLLGQITKSYEKCGVFILKYFSNEYLAQSNNAATWISRITGEKFHTLPNSIDLELFEASAIQNTNNKPKLRVLFVGRLVEGKGAFESLDVVLKANEILKQHGVEDSFEFTIIGSGGLESKLIKEVDKYGYRFLGERQHPQVISAMYESDILIQVYEQEEGLTTVTLEALATGMLVVTTPLSGDSNLLNCPNYMEGQEASLPDILVKASKRHESRADLIATGREFIRSGFTWEASARKLLTKDF